MKKVTVSKNHTVHLINWLLINQPTATFEKVSGGECVDVYVNKPKSLKKYIKEHTTEPTPRWAKNG